MERASRAHRAVGVRVPGPGWLVLLPVLAVVLLVVGTAGTARAEDPPPPRFGATLDWSDDGARAYAQRLDVRPAVLDKATVLPVTADERRFLDQFFTQATDVGALPSVSLEPTVPLADLRDDDLVEAARVLGAMTERYGTDATVTFAAEMNNPDRPWALRPADYVPLARSFADAVRREAPRVSVVWVPAEASRAVPYEGAPAALPEGGPHEAALDSTGDGVVDRSDDAYGPYWPGAEAVDEVGLAVRYLGSSPPAEGAVLEAVRDGPAGGSGDFAARFSEEADRPLELRTAAAVEPGSDGSERGVKAAWERQLLDASTREQLPRLTRILWLEVAREEPAVDGDVVDWRATRTPALAGDLRTTLQESVGPASGDDVLSPWAATRPGGGSVLTGAPAWGVAAAGWTAGLGLLALGLSGRLRSWRYPEEPEHRRRDLRIDLLRGVAICFVVVNHINVPSAYHLVSQEALGPLSGAELFVALSGVVLGVVYRPRAEKSVRTEATLPLWSRAWRLYVTALAVVVLAYLSGFVPGVDARVLTTFTDQGSGGAAGATYDLYAGFGAAAVWPLPGYIVGDLLSLQLGPYQFNVIGLYVVLLLVTPFLLLALERGRLLVVLGLSLAVYGLQQVYPVRLLPSQFEDAFPLLTWQVLFVLGLVFGWYRAELVRAAGTRAGRAVLAACVVLFLAGVFISWNNPYLTNRYDVRLALIPEETYARLYAQFFERTTLDVGRLLVVVVTLVTLYAALTAFWRPVARVLGPVLVPLGQATLYVFILHVFFALVVANVPALAQGTVLRGTLTHTVVLAALWLMVRTGFLFRLIPR